MAHDPAQHLDFLGIGFGPMHLGLACYFEDHPVRPLRARFIERRHEFTWHAGLQFAGSLMQTPFLKDLASMRDPRSEFTFVNYLRECGRLEAFIDNRIVYPTRAEFEDYLRWAARRMARYVEYGSAAESVEPLLDGRGELAAFRVVTSGGGHFDCTHLSIGAGLTCAPGAPMVRVVPVADYEHRIADLLEVAGEQPRVLVVGAGQSGAEVVLDLMRRHRGAQVEVASRGFVFRTVEANPLVNGLFAEPAHRLFRALPLDTRKAWLHDLRLSNYGAVDEQVVTAISRLVYDESVCGRSRLQRHNYTALDGLAPAGDQVRATLRDLHSGQAATEPYDLVIDCRGFGTSQVSRLLAPLLPFLPAKSLEDLELDEHYAVRDLRSPSCRLFLHGYGSYLVDTTMICNIAQRAEAVGRAVHG